MSFVTAAQQKVIRLYEGKAPGSENWNWSEGEVFAGPPMNAMIAYNVTNPTLVVYEPDTPNGVAVILCTGGSYHVLNIEHEGTNVAKQLNKNGFTVFLFKYRLVRSLTNDPWQEMMETRKNPEALREKMAPLRIMAITDLNRAIVSVRKHAAEYKIDANKIGIMGFSAGGFMVANVAYNFIPEARPDFIAPIYCVITSIENRIVKADAPPLFIAAATDDALAPVSNSVELYTDWMKAKKPAELHLYAKGGHGLRGTPASTWIDRFVEWLHVQGFLNSKSL
ncbi:MAG: alpha/beta hydrolase [Chitinophagaceae bacterium]